MDCDSVVHHMEYRYFCIDPNKSIQTRGHTEMTLHSIIRVSIIIIILIPLIPRLLLVWLSHYCCALFALTSPTSYHHRLKLIVAHSYPRRSTPFKRAARICRDARPGYMYEYPFISQPLSSKMQLMVLPRNC